ncbi:MAG: PQQ-binding-like beta-propeller repeat protein [Bacteroidales bacterium]|nr:PQQ-binding-like beta-propeller repeat protein [Bacteroidales bacterium]
MKPFPIVEKTMNKGANINIKLWNAVAWIAGVFTFIICILTIANYIQISRVDPVNTETINLLVERLSQNPADDALRQQIRELDLLARKAYFTNQWQIRTGGYFILIGIALLVIAIQMLQSAQKIKPEISKESTDYLLRQKNTRRWISIGGTLVVLTALIFAFLTHNQMNETFQQASIVQEEPEIKEVIPEHVKQQEPVVIAAKKQEKPEPIITQAETNEEAKPKEELKDAEIKKEETVLIITKEAVAEEVKVKDTTPEPTQASSTYSDEVLKNFSTFRGPGSNGIVYHNNVPLKWDGTTGENLLWKTKIPVHGYNSPVIWEDKIFISGATSDDRLIYCFDLNTGELLWTGNITGIKGSPSTAPETTPDTGHAAPTVTTDGKYVYAIFSNGDIAAFDFEGNMTWGRNLGVPSNHYGHSSSLITFNDKLIVQYDHRKEAKVMALSTSTGETLWSTPRKVKVSWASPVLVNTGTRWEVILSADPIVASYDPETGEELWQLDCMSGEVGPSIGYADGIVYGMNEYASLVAIKLGDPLEKIWEDDEYLSDVPSPIATDKYLFIATSYGVFICYDAKTGTKYWEAEFDNGFYSSPILVGENIYISDRKGIVHIFKADKEYIAVGSNLLGEDTDTTPAVVNGKIVIRGKEHLFCFGVKE